MSAQPSIQNPFVGPESYARYDERIFAGRENEARNLLSLVLSSRVVLFYAQSGAGKTSLINARLIPDLEKRGFEVLPVGRVSGSAINPGQVDNVYIYNLMLSLHRKQEALDPARFGKICLSDFLLNLASDEDRQYFYTPPKISERETGFPNNPAPADTSPDAPQIWPRALIIDQFEEILTAYPEAWKTRAAFFEQINQAMRDDDHLWVIFAMRQDYVATLRVEYAHLLPGSLQTRYYMQPMDTIAAFKAITEPVKTVNQKFEVEVANDLVAELSRITIKRPDGSTTRTEGKFVEAVQLQVACYQLWENLKASSKAVITRQDIDAVVAKSHSTDLAEFIDNALAEFYSQAVAEIALETGHLEFDLRHWFETRLITPGRARAFVVEEGDTVGGLDQDIVRLLQTKFLIRSEERAGVRIYELVHDRFIDLILQSNLEWEKDHPHIQAAREWFENDRDGSKLYSGIQLEAAWRHPDARIKMVEDFLNAGEKAEQGRQSENLRSFVIWALIIFILVLVPVFIRARYDRTTAVVQRDAAVTSAADATAAVATAAAALSTAEADFKSAEAARAAANAAAQNANDSRTIIILHGQAEDYEQTSGSSDIPLLLNLEAFLISDTVETRAKLSAGLTPEIGSTTYEQFNPYNRVTVSPDGATLAVADKEGELWLWDIAGQREILVAPPHTQPIYGLAFDPQGQRLAITTGNRNIDPAEPVHSIELWEIAKGITQTLSSQTGSVWSVAFSPDGKRLATGHYNGDVILWDISSTPPTSQILHGHSDWVWNVAFHPTDSDILVSSGKDARILAWDLNATPPITTTELFDHAAWVNQVAFSPDGRKLASASDDNTVRLWDLTAGHPVGEILFEHGFEAWNVKFSPSGRFIASGGGDGRIILWDLVENRQVGAALSGHESGVEGVVFSEGTLISVGHDGRLVFWDLREVEGFVGLSLEEIACRKAQENIPWQAFKSAFEVNSIDEYRKTCNDLPAPRDVIEALLAKTPQNTQQAQQILEQAIALAGPEPLSGVPAPETVLNILLELSVTGNGANLRDAYILAGKELAPSFHLSEKLAVLSKITQARAAYVARDYTEAKSLLDEAAGTDLQGGTYYPGELARLYAIICRAAGAEDVELPGDACRQAIETGQAYQSSDQFQRDTITFRGQPSQTLTLDLQTGGGLSIDFDLIDAETAQRIEPNLIDPRYKFRVFTPVESKDYLIVVESDDIYRSVPYRANSKELLNSGQIQIDQEIRGNLEPDTYNQWNFDVAAGELVRVRMTPSNGIQRPYLALFKSDTGFVDSTSQDEGGTVTVRGGVFPEEVRYTLLVADRGGGAGAYRIELVRENPRPIDFGQVMQSNFHEQILWSFEAQADQLIDIAMTDSDPNFYPYLLLMDGEGREITSNDDSGGEYNARIASFVVPHDGEYIIRAGGTGIPANYWLSLSEVAAQWLEFNQAMPVAPNFDGAWIFEKQSGRVDVVTFLAEGVGPEQLPAFSLKQPDGSIIFSTPISGSDQVVSSIVLSQDGLYILRPSALDITGPYTITLQTVEPERIIPPLGQALTVSGVIPPNGYQLWIFEAEADQTVRIEMLKDNSELDTYVTLYGPDGIYMIDNDDRDLDTNSLIDDYPLPVTGEYIILAHGYADSAGAYRLTLTINPP